jgi:rod shape-determining protein MreD
VIIDLLTYFLRLLLLLLIQLLVVNNIELNTYINPYIYPLFILTLPVNTKPWQVVCISFAVGMTMDIFSSTPGLHMAATTFMGYVRIYFLRFAATKEDFESRISPTLSKKGPAWFLFYTFVLLFFHHLLLFYFEVYGFSEFFRTFFRVILSTIFSVMLIGLGQILFYRVANKSNG